MHFFLVRLRFKILHYKVQNFDFWVCFPSTLATLLWVLETNWKNIFLWESISGLWKCDLFLFQIFLQYVVLWADPGSKFFQKETFFFSHLFHRLTFWNLARIYGCTDSSVFLFWKVDPASVIYLVRSVSPIYSW